MLSTARVRYVVPSNAWSKTRWQRDFWRVSSAQTTWWKPSSLMMNSSCKCVTASSSYLHLQLPKQPSRQVARAAPEAKPCKITESLDGRPQWSPELYMHAEITHQIYLPAMRR